MERDHAQTRPFACSRKLRRDERVQATDSLAGDLPRPLDAFRRLSSDLWCSDVTCEFWGNNPEGAHEAYLIDEDEMNFRFPENFR